MDVKQLIKVIEKCAFIMVDICKSIYKLLIYVIVSKVTVYLGIIEQNSIMAAILTVVFLILVINEFMIFIKIRWPRIW